MVRWYCRGSPGYVFREFEQVGLSIYNLLGKEIVMAIKVPWQQVKLHNRELNQLDWESISSLGQELNCQESRAMHIAQPQPGTQQVEPGQRHLGVQPGQVHWDRLNGPAGGNQQQQTRPHGQSRSSAF